MPTCFIIQPFDGDVFDKRGTELFEPAIENAGLTPYRVDRDTRVSVPISAIEQGIRDADVCFAEISTNNPNVWYELGFAMASSKEVVLVCSQARKEPFPFDVQHRHIIRYKSDAPSDFKTLSTDITNRLKSAVERGRTSQTLAEISTIANAEGLSPHEIATLISIAEIVEDPDGGASTYQIKEAARKAGFTDVAVVLALRSLLNKSMVKNQQERNEYGDGESYTVYLILDAGWAWLEANQDKLIIQHPPARPRKGPLIPNEEIPF